MSKLGENTVQQQEEGFVDRVIDATPQSNRPSSLRLKINADNTIAWDSEEQKQKFALVATSDPDALELIGGIVGDEGGADGISGISDEEAKMALVALSSIEAVAFRYLLKIDPDIAMKCAQFSKEEQDQIAPIAAKVMDKYLSENARKYKEETALAILLYMSINRQAKTAKHCQMLRNQENGNIQPNGHAEPQSVRPQ